MLVTVPKAGQEKGAYWRQRNKIQETHIEVKAGVRHKWTAETKAILWKSKRLPPLFEEINLQPEIFQGWMWDYSSGLQYAAAIMHHFKCPKVPKWSRVVFDFLCVWLSHYSRITPFMKSSLNPKALLSIGDILKSTKCQVCVAFGCGHPTNIRTTENH